MVCEAAGSSSAPRRVVVVDQSLHDNVGHHIEYDLAIARACSVSGVECIVCAHRGITAELDLGPNLDPAFSTDMWGGLRTTAPLAIRIRVFALQALQATLFFPAILWSFVNSIERVGPRSVKIWLYRMRVAAKAAIAQCARAKRRFSHWARTLFPEKSLFRKALRFGLRTLRQILGTVPRILPSPRWLTLLLLEDPITYFELKNALRRHAVGKGDLIFCHMLVGRTLGAWALVADEVSRRGREALVLLFRYPVHFYVPNSLRAKIAFRTLERAWERGHVRFATDSSRLAEEFADATYVPFELFPIPHTGDQQCDDVRTSHAGPDHVVRFCSLGNARAEKGILEIFDAIRQLNASQVGSRVHFVLQVNDPDREAGPAVEAFRAEGYSNVDLVEEALSHAEYRTLLMQSDIVLVPYWSDVYKSRTSGVFLEAIAAGKPVIATADTWMTDELGYGGAGLTVRSRSGTELAGVMRSAAEQFRQLQRKAIAEADLCRKFHSPQSLLDHLLQKSSRRVSDSPAVLMVYPWGNLLERSSGAAMRSGLILDYLRRLGLKTRVLLPSGRDQSPPATGMDVHEFKDSGFGRSGDFFLTAYVALWRFCTMGRSKPAEWLLYAHTRWQRNRAFKLALNRAIIGMEALLVEYTFLADVVAKHAHALRIPLIVGSHDVLADQASYLPLRNCILEREVEALRLADLATATTKSDCDRFNSYGANVKHVPIALNLDDTDVLPELEARAILLAHFVNLNAQFVLFVGSRFAPNIEAKDALKKVAIELAERDPTIHVVVIGDCASPQESKGTFVALGRVSDNLKRALYSLARAVVIPLGHGTGMPVKTIEAMAYGCAVIGTPLAFRSLGLRDGEEVIVEPDLAQYPRRILRLVSSAELRSHLQESALKWAQQLDYRRVYRIYGEFLATRTSLRFSRSTLQLAQTTEKHDFDDRGSVGAVHQSR